MIIDNDTQYVYICTLFFSIHTMYIYTIHILSDSWVSTTNTRHIWGETSCLPQHGSRSAAGTGRVLCCFLSEKPYNVGPPNFSYIYHKQLLLQLYALGAPHCMSSNAVTLDSYTLTCNSYDLLRLHLTMSSLKAFKGHNSGDSQR